MTANTTKKRKTNRTNKAPQPLLAALLAEAQRTGVTPIIGMVRNAPKK